MIDVTPHRRALEDRIAVVTKLIDETHPKGPVAGPISREARGLAIVLLFAAYEELLVSLTRTLLEAVVRLRISNRRLQPGLRAFALRSSAESLRDVSERRLFISALPNLVDVAARSDQKPTVNTGDFPKDGSFMKQSQIKVWAKTFGVDHPRLILSHVWDSIDAIVVQRNGVAHGSLTPQEVGRAYSEDEIRQLVADWWADWDAFLLHVNGLASSRNFFRLPR